MHPARAGAVLVLLVALSAAALAQVAAPGELRAARFAGSLYVELVDVARTTGATVTAGAGVLTFRGVLGVVTFFAGSADALHQRPGDAGPTEVALSAPVVESGGDWWAPLAAMELLGMAPGPGEGAVVLPDGTEAQLALEAFPGTQVPAPPAGGEAAWEVDSLEGGLPALRFFSGETALTLIDLSLLPLARPDLTRAVDAALDAAWRSAGSGGDSLLLLQVTALSDATWDATLRFSQGSRELEVRYPYRLLLQEGSAETVGPGTPVAGVVLLPAAFDLYRPLVVEWAGIPAEVTFRR